MTIIVGMILVTTLVTPPLLRISFKEPRQKDKVLSINPDAGEENVA